MTELHLFIIWHNARHKEKDILDDLSQRFDVAKIFNVKWSKRLFPKNLSRLYGKKLWKTHKKSRLVGRDDFLAVVLHDANPVYEDGKNKNICTAKAKYRELTGGGHLVHASDTPDEAVENMLLLFGEDAVDSNFLYAGDPIAAKGWEDENSLVNFIAKIGNSCFEKGKMFDVIKTDQPEKLGRLINATPVFWLYAIKMNGKLRFLKIKKCTG